VYLYTCNKVTVNMHYNKSKICFSIIFIHFNVTSRLLVLGKEIYTFKCLFLNHVFQVIILITEYCELHFIVFYTMSGNVCIRISTVGTSFHVYSKNCQNILLKLSCCCCYLCKKSVFYC